VRQDVRKLRRWEGDGSGNSDPASFFWWANYAAAIDAECGMRNNAGRWEDVKVRSWDDERQCNLASGLEGSTPRLPARRAYSSERGKAEN
jgi:hypothetical protein